MRAPMRNRTIDLPKNLETKETREIVIDQGIQTLGEKTIEIQVNLKNETILDEANSIS
jgi:hypothetical protein